MDHPDISHIPAGVQVESYFF